MFFGHVALVGCPEGDIPLDDDSSAPGDDDIQDDDPGLSDCLYYADQDEDGYGNPDDELLESCDGPPEG